MYNNVLAANWEPGRLGRLILLGNPLAEVAEGLGAANLAYLTRAAAVTQHSRRIPDSPSLPGFNNTCY